MDKLGTIELSADILKKAKIGLWAFELDDGCAPRMYVDDAMLNLLGLTEQISPEETYHAWYDHIDPDHYDEVHEAVDKMTAGTHAEVQYPWHHPNGDTWIVRCGGVRNHEYKQGVRIEGTHQNVTQITHFQKRTLADMLATLSENFLDVYFLDPYTGVFQAYSNKTSADGNGIKDISGLNFYDGVAQDAANIVHSDDYHIIDEMYSRDNLIHILENNGTEEFVVRWPIGHDKCLYMKNKITAFDDYDSSKKLIIGVQDVTTDNEYSQLLEEKLIIMEALGKDYDYVDIIDLYDDKRMDKSRHFKTPAKSKTVIPEWNSDIPYTKKLDLICDNIVYAPDKESFRAQTRREEILKQLKKDSIYYVNFRMIAYDIIHYAQIKFIGITDENGKINRFFAAYINADKQMTQQMELRNKLSKALQSAQIANDKNNALVRGLSGDIRSTIREIIFSDDKALNHISDPDVVKACLLKNNMNGRRVLGVLNDMLETTDEFEAEQYNKSVQLDPSILKGKHVLLVEDNPLNMEIAQDILEDFEMVIEPAVNGRIAVDKCRKAFIDKECTAPDIILMDIQMPEMNGYEAAQAIRSFASKEAKYVPILAMTANAFEEDKKKSYESGMDAHISKPIDTRELEKMMISLLG